MCPSSLTLHKTHQSIQNNHSPRSIILSTSYSLFPVTRVPMQAIVIGVMITQIIELVLLIACSVLLVLYYSDHQVKVYVKVLVSVSWCLSFLIILILPLDITYTQRDQSVEVIKHIWMIVYYVNFVFTWLILPIAQQYENAGEFTWKGRLKSSLISNGILMGIFLVFGVALTIYLALSGDFTLGMLPSIFATLANLFGILLVVIFLGHGLISMPKHFYNRSFPNKTLSHNYKTAGLINSKIEDLQFEVDIEIRKLYHLQSTGEFIVINLATQILNDIPSDIKAKTSSNSKVFDLIDIQNPSEPKMIQLSQRLKKKIRELRMYDSWLKDIVSDTKFIVSQTSKNNYLHLKVLNLCLMVCTTLISMILFFGEMSSFITALEDINILKYIDEAQPAVSYILNSLLLLYMTYIITYAVFEMNVFGLFSLHKRHSTASSMLFMSVNLARISYPLCYNYLQITGMPPIAFLDFFGEIHIGDKHVFIFPILLITFAVFNLLNIYDRAMGCLGLGRFAFGEQDQSTQQIGRRVVQKLTKRSAEISEVLPVVSFARAKEGDYLQMGRF